MDMLPIPRMLQIRKTNDIAFTTMVALKDCQRFPHFKTNKTRVSVITVEKTNSNAMKKIARIIRFIIFLLVGCLYLST